MTDPKIPAASQAVIDKHLAAMMDELETADFQALGVVAGVLCEGETAVSWCVKDDVVDSTGKPIPVDDIVRDIAIGIEMATAK